MYITTRYSLCSICICSTPKFKLIPLFVHLHILIRIMKDAPPELKKVLQNKLIILVHNFK